jgi:uncharacterized RDD family membrane protein YckC
VVEPKYRTFWPRFWAGFVDGLVFLPVTAVNLVAFRDGVPVWLRVVWYLASSFAFIAYVVWMHGRYGQTLGKMATHVRVLDVSESKLSGRQAFMREIVPIVLTAIVVVHDLPSVLSGADPSHPSMPLSDPRAVPMPVPRFPIFYWIAFAASFGWFAAELLTMLTNDKRRAVHDFIASSVVVRSPSPALSASGGVV